MWIDGSVRAALLGEQNRAVDNGATLRDLAQEANERADEWENLAERIEDLLAIIDDEEKPAPIDTNDYPNVIQ